MKSAEFYEERAVLDAEVFLVRKNEGLNATTLSKRFKRSESFVKSALKRHSLKHGVPIPPITEKHKRYGWKKGHPRKQDFQPTTVPIEDLYGGARYKDERWGVIEAGEAELMSEVDLYNRRFITSIVEPVSSTPSSMGNPGSYSYRGVTLAGV